MSEDTLEDDQEAPTVDQSYKVKNATELGQLCDEHAVAKAERLAADKVAKALKTKESRLEAEIIWQMQKQKISSIGGERVIYGLPKPTDEPVVKDWLTYWAYLVSLPPEQGLSLIEKRPGRAAIKERWTLGESVPGITKFPIYKLTKTGVK